MKSALWAAAAMLAIVFGVCAGTCLAGCAAVDLAKYKKDAAECRNLPTCEEYVACRKSVEADAGSKWAGHCLDGGTYAR